jgi:membrane-bound serine protease (ClpP class)
MVAVGVLLVLVGAALLVAEAHVPAGAFGIAGGLALAGGAALAIAAAGGGLAIVLPVVVGASAAAALWLWIATRKALTARTARARSGREALSGHLGVVRSWSDPPSGGLPAGGQVLVDGALWRARLSWDEDGAGLREGDAVVVEGVSGLTLAVRKAEDWESPL